MVKEFVEYENCLVAVLSLAVCSLGTALSSAKTVIFAESHWNADLMNQPLMREQPMECLSVYYLFGRDTLDEVVFPLINLRSMAPPMNYG